MSLIVSKGTFAAPTGTGNISVDHAGLTQTPKALLLFAIKRTTGGFAQHIGYCMGAATSSSQRWAATCGADDAAGVQNTNTAREFSTSAVMKLPIDGSTGSVDGILDFVSFDADSGSGAGFTLNCSNGFASAWIIHYVLFSGTDITNAKAGNFTVATSGTPQSFTDPGFKPDFLLFGNARTGSTSASLVAGIGAASGASAEAAMSIINLDNQVSAAVAQYQRSTMCLVEQNSSSAVDLEADLASFDTNGFTLNVPNPGPGNPTGYLALRGGMYKVGVETQKTSTGTKATTGVGFLPKGLILFGANATANASLDQQQAHLSLGGTDGTNVGSVNIVSKDDVTTPDENQSTRTDKIIQHTTAPNTINAEATISSLDSDGFTLNWTAADATAREFAYVAFGDAKAATGSAGVSGGGSAAASTKKNARGAAGTSGSGTFGSTGGPTTTTTDPASSIFEFGATLNGTVFPNGSPTSYRFEYGRTTSYGSVTPPIDAGSGFLAVHAAATVIGLEPFTTYHYRIVADDGGDPILGADETFTTGIPMPYSHVVLEEEGLVSRWKLTETSGTAADDDKGSNDGTYTGGYTLGQDGLVADGDRSVLLNGTSGFVACGTGGAQAGDMSAEAWVRTPASLPTTNRVIFCRTAGNPWPQNFILEAKYGESPDVFAFGSNVNSDIRARSSTVIAPSTTYHVVGTFVLATKTWKIYVNGELVGTTVGSAAPPTSTMNLAIGCSNESPAAFFWNGHIDEVALYNVALTADRIRAHYEVGAYGIGRATDLDDLGVVPPVQMTGNAANGHDIQSNSGMVFLELANSGASTRTVTITSTATADGLEYEDRVVSLSAGETKISGPFWPPAYNDVYDRIHVTPSHSDVKMRAYCLG